MITTSTMIIAPAASDMITMIYKRNLIAQAISNWRNSHSATLMSSRATFELLLLPLD